MVTCEINLFQNYFRLHGRSSEIILFPRIGNLPEIISKLFRRLIAPHEYSDLEFSRLESWSRDVSRPVFTSLGLGLGLEPRNLGLGLGTSESWSRSWNPPVSVSVLGLVGPETLRH